MFEALNLFLIFFFLPTQLGLHFWPFFSYLQGYRVDYLSPTFYFTDLLLIIYLLRHLSNIKTILTIKIKKTLPLIVFLILNLLFSLSPLNTLFWFLRLIIYFVFVYLLRFLHYPLSKVFLPLLLGVSLQIFLAIFQFTHQSSLDGFWYYLGERHFSLSTPQIAKFNFFGHLLLRPYATFSHPNAFAGFLFLVLLLTRQITISFSKAIQAILIISILLTGSKAVLIVTILLYLNSPLFFNLFLSFLLTFLLPLLPHITSTLHTSLPYTLSSRLTFLQHTTSLLIHYPIFGVGYGNYLVGLTNILPTNQLLPSLLQPVHNLPLLLISEFGLVGLFPLITVYRYKFKNFPSKNLVVLSLLLVLSVFDHYFYTLPQTKLLLLIVLGYLV